MNILVLYDSNFGNTEKIAETIATELNGKCCKVNDCNPESLIDVDVLIIGSPIIAWRPLPSISKFIENLSAKFLTKTYVAVFDTRVKSIFSGNAAKHMANALQIRGAKLLSEPQGVIVKGKEGPLAEHELERAAAWARSFMRQIN
ncbi:MAG TPA: flavodoxin domain-containing protein [Bacteroidia bacterium]